MAIMRNCGMCGKDLPSLDIIDLPSRGLAVCRECARQLSPPLTPQELHGVYPKLEPVTLVQAAAGVAFWMRAFGVVYIVGAMILLCVGCVALHNSGEAWFVVILSSAFSFCFGLGTLSLARWFTLYNTIVQDMDRRIPKA